MVNGLEFFQRKEIKDILAYLHLLNNPRDEVALRRVINVPVRGIGKITIDRLSEFARQHGIAMIEAARRAAQIPAIGRRPATLVAKFVALFDHLTTAVDGPVEKILGLVLSETGYQKQLSESADEGDQERLANIEELLTVARDFDERHEGTGQLEAFLEETCLVNDTDAWETESDRVTLMTLHASKGLEFPVVFLTAVEEGLLPHERSREDLNQLEEERRLMFVGITRAQQELQLSLARYRDFRGQRKLTIPSSFLMELPRTEMELEFPGGVQGGMTHFTSVEEDHGEDDHCQIVPDDDWHDQSDPPGSSEADPPLSKTVSEAPPCADPVDSSSDPPITPPATRESQGRESRRPVLPKIHLTTAAALANGGGPAAPVDPDLFRQGTCVLHASFGLGWIIAISGSGLQREATVDFPPPSGRQTLRLAEGTLRPVKA
jgi:DNA helicase-2/ATP-dependent DNA helicase PcrA